MTSERYGPHGLEMVQIPKGSFLMGTAISIGGYGECPQHEVRLDPFSIAQTPVTNAQYALYLENPVVLPDRKMTQQEIAEFILHHLHNPKEEPHHWRDERYNQPSQPVVGISWNGAQAYCAWAGLSLPTEAQWEYACRAGTTTRYHSGDTEEDLARVGWYDENSGRQRHDVGLKDPNAFGLYDMHGNVWEWCADKWSESSTLRVFRGGCWFNVADNMRSAFRYAYRPYKVHIMAEVKQVNFDVGFRPVGK